MSPPVWATGCDRSCCRSTTVRSPFTIRPPGCRSSRAGKHPARASIHGWPPISSPTELRSVIHRGRLSWRYPDHTQAAFRQTQPSRVSAGRVCVPQVGHAIGAPILSSWVASAESSGACTGEDALEDELGWSVSTSGRSVLPGHRSTVTAPSCPAVRDEFRITARGQTVSTWWVTLLASSTDADLRGEPWLSEPMLSRPRVDRRRPPAWWG